MFAYRLDELRFVAEDGRTSAADALTWEGLVVPEKKIWTIISGFYFPSAAETRTVEFGKYTRGFTLLYPLRTPQSITLGPSIFLPFLTEGNQLILLPGEKLGVRRDVATAGSTMTIYYQYVESDMPIARYIEPQRELSIKRRRPGFAPFSNLGSARSALGSSEGEGGGGEGVPGEGGGIPV